MHQVNIHEAKTNLSKLIEEAVQGEPFIIAKAGKPLVKVMALATPTGTSAIAGLAFSALQSSRFESRT